VPAALLSDAWPQIVQIALRAGIVLALTIVVQQRFGDTATVSLGVTTRFDTLVLFAALGFANAATAYSGRAVVVGWPSRARLAGGWAALQAGAFGALCVWLFNRYPETLLAWCRPGASAELVSLTVLYFATAAWSQVFGAMALGAIGAVHGAGRMQAPLLVDLFGFALAGLLLWNGASGATSLRAVYLALVAGMAVVAAGQALFVMFGRWPRAA
jgi:Na+-driven multidrug efflux pump